MIIPFPCPACGATIEAEMKGLKRKVVNCPACDQQVQVPDDLPLGPGVTIGNGYKLVSKIGDTSLGESYLAEKEGRQYTVEVLSGETSRDQEKVTRLMQETDTLASMKHANIVEAVEAGQDSETYFLVTAYEPGMPLDQYLQENAPLTCETALEICSCIAEALEYAWEERKIVHREIKPENILVTETGSAKLTGFGIAKSQEGQALGLTGVGFTIGTPQYMSPEQAQGNEDLDFRSDLYALGIVLYQCVTGELPFDDPAPMVLVMKHINEPHEPANQKNPEVTGACSAVIDRMLQKERMDRYETWKEAIAEMKKAKAAPAPSPVSASSAPAAASAGGSAPAPAAASGGGDSKQLVLVVMGGAVVVLILIIVLVLVLRH